MFWLKLFSRLPFFLLYRVSDIVYIIVYYIVGYRKRLVRKNLGMAFPALPVSDLGRIERAFYRRLCDYGFETLKLLTLSRAALARRMVFTNDGLIRDYHRNGQSVLYFASHQFNWEWLLAAGSFVLPYPVRFIYQKISSPFFERLSLTCRSRFGATAVEREQVARETLRGNGHQAGIAIMADQYPGHGRDKKYITTFLNQETAFFEAPNSLAYLTQYPAVFFKLRRVRRGHYAAEAVIIGEPPYERGDHQVLDNYVKEVEAVIATDPPGWLWSHNRWKTRHLNSA